MVSLIKNSEILKPTPTLPTACGVKVLSWGTSFDSGSGILHVLDSTLFGGNSGHAALLLTFPNNEEGKRLMALCKKNRIPCKEKTVYHDQNRNKIKEEVIQVNWSWCSSNEKDENFPHFLQTAEEDLLGARQAVHFEWDLEKIEKLQLETPEQRHHHGLLSSHVASYGPAKVLHRRNLSDGQRAFLESKNAAELLAKKEATINILSEKLLKNKEKLAKYKTVKLGVTEQLILNKYLPEWKKLEAVSKI